MDNLTPKAKSLINDMLKICADNLERRMRQMIERQHEFYQETKQKTIGKMLGQVEDSYSLVQNFKYQETIGSTLREMEQTFLEYFGKPWNYVEPMTEPTQPPKVKRGRPKKN
jgi:hypothetical protein